MNPVLHELIVLVSEAAPLLGSILAGKFGGVIGKVIANVFGETEGDQANLVQKIKDDPDSDNKLQMIESMYSKTLVALHTIPLPSKIDVNLTVEWKKDNE